MGCIYMDKESGNVMYALAETLFPICRSLTGDGVRKTLRIIKEIVPEINMIEVPTGTQAFDWTVPREWNIKDGYIEDAKGKRILSFHDHNLHVMGYSLPVDRIVSRNELLDMIYTLPDQPDVIPYVTSYYKQQSGFCMTYNQMLSLKEEEYHAVIDSEVKDGFLTYGEVIIPGETEQEIFFSTYICHPSMANNELSGPCVVTELIKYVKRQSRKYTYRFIFVPETIGAIFYLSRHMEELKKNVIAGFTVSCVGDDRTYSYVSSRYGNSLVDKVAKNILSFHYPQYKAYSFLERGSDERQYCAPGVDLPICAICRSKYREYPEYHTSADDLGLISPEGLLGGFDVYRKCIDALEANEKYKVSVLCEPQLGKRGLYPEVSRKGVYNEVKIILDFIAYADGNNDLIDISDIIGVPTDKLIEIAGKLYNEKLINIVDRQ